MAVGANFSVQLRDLHLHEDEHTKKSSVAGGEFTHFAVVADKNE